MSQSLLDSRLPTAERPLALRARCDLIASRQFYQGHPWWVLKDPLALSYFRFAEEEYGILRMLDGRISLSEVKRRFEQEFAPQRITVEEVQQFVGSLYQSGLVVASAAGQGEQLKKRRDKRKGRERLASLTNILSIRFRGIDPDRMLTVLYPWVRWVFSPWAVALVVATFLTAGTLVAVQFELFVSKLPTFHQFFSPSNMIWLAIAMGATKVLHECGHAFSCKHFGGECHEMGVMFLVLTPCLYVNVSDSWLLPSKWRRAAIGAAGIYVEGVIASLATFTWWFTEPGLINNLCLSLIFVCSVNTLIFNGNPLMRYDGYYILADLIEIPNLQQKSKEVLQRFLGRVCLGLETPDDPFLPRKNRWLFGTYALASAVYRWVVALSILWFLHKFFEPYRLEIIGHILAMLSLYALIVMPLWGLFKFFRVPGRMYQVKRKKLLTTLAVAGALILGVLLLPLPHHIYCTLEIKPRKPVSVYVEQAGTLVSIKVRPGQVVENGELIAQLRDIDLELEVADLEAQHAAYRAQRDSLSRQRLHDPAAAVQVPQVDEMLVTVEELLRKKEVHQGRLLLKARASGTILPPDPVPEPAGDEDRLPTWSGTPMDKQNLGCFLQEKVVFCQIGNPKRMYANLVIDQGDVEFVDAGQAVEICLDHLPGDIFDGKIEHIALEELRVSPKMLTNKSGGELATKTDAAGRERLISAAYQAHVPLDDEEGVLKIGLRGRAKIHTGWQTIGRRLARYFAQLFNFQL